MKFLLFLSFLLKLSVVIIEVSCTPLKRTVSGDQSDKRDVNIQLLFSSNRSPSPKQGGSRGGHQDYMALVNKMCDHCLDDMNPAQFAPAYPCDTWDKKSLTCYLDRNIGDTVTFKLKVPHDKKRYKITWELEFHTISKERKVFSIKNDEPLWNVVIGSMGHEFRISPVTEMDMDSNTFSATMTGRDVTNDAKIYFRIRPIPIDLGYVYPGETLVLNMAGYINLPLESLQYLWYSEADGESRPLWSNMRTSPSGGSLSISELRAIQEGVVACAVYTNRGFQVAKKRFFIKEMNANEELLEDHDRSRRLPSRRHRRRHSRAIELEKRIEEALRKDEESTADPEDEGFADEMPPKKNVYDDESLMDAPDTSRQLPPPTFKIIEGSKKASQLSYQVEEQGDDEEQGVTTRRSNEVSKRPKVHVGTTEWDGVETISESRMVSETEDKLSEMIAECSNDKQCSGHASCAVESGFCRCRTGYQGNGISCWESFSSTV